MASTDSLEDNTGFAQKNGASFPILADPGKDMCRSYGVLAESGYARRRTFYIDTDGIIRKIDDKVDVRNAGKQLVENLKSLGYPEVSGS